jgi:hypothetical protein
MFWKSSLINKARVAMACTLWLFLGGVVTVQAEGFKINSTFEGGVDAWAITPRQTDKPQGPFSRLGSAYEDHYNLALPDGETKWNYQPVSPWMRFTSNVRLNSNLEVNFKVRADQLMGVRVDVANFDWAPSPYVGLRAGVVNFNTNWCRTYDVDSPWIAEPDVFCRRNDFMNINNAAPGLQAYTNTSWGDYQMQTIVGVYRPRLFSYETKEFGFNTDNLGPHFKHEFNRKISAAINFLNLKTGTQLRLGAMRSDEAGFYDPKLTNNDRSRHNLVDNYYVGIDTYLHPTLRLRYSVSKFSSRDFYDDVLIIRDKDKSETLELIYDWKSTDLLALGWSRFSQAASVDDAFKNYKADDYYLLNHSALLTSWRHQWGKGMYSTLQWTHASQTNGYEGRRRPGSGDAVGVRLGYQY